MLVLSRKEGESVMIGDQIRVTVTRIDPDAVKLGFTAPSKTLIYRDEIYREIKEANREALRRPVVGSGVPALRIDRRVGGADLTDSQVSQKESVVETSRISEAELEDISLKKTDDSLDSDPAL
jgi:carbon storage regulator